MNYIKFFFISNFFLNLYLMTIVNINFVSSYYILPFKHIRTSLSELYKIYPDKTKDEIFLNYTNNFNLLTPFKITDSFIYYGILKSGLLCTSLSYDSYISDSDYNLKNNNTYINISNIFNKIKIDSNNTNHVEILIGLGITQFNLSHDCISFAEEIKKNDNSIKTYTWSIKYNENIHQNNNFDGEILMGIEPHEYQPLFYKDLNYHTINSYLNEVSDYYPMFENNDFGILFNSIYFYNNNDYSSENIIKIVNPTSMDGFLSFNHGMVQSPLEYMTLIKNNYFDKYPCKKVTFSLYYFTFVCDKSQINTEFFIKSFPTLYFKHIDLNYIFELTSKDLFMEENNKLYFMIYSSDTLDFRWILGEIFLKKYFFTFNQNKKSIGFYENMKGNGDDGSHNKNKDDNNIGIIILFIGIGLIVINIIIGIFVWKKACGNNRRKRANELNDDNYDYLADNTNNNKIINDI